MSSKNGTQAGLDCYFIEVVDLNLDLPKKTADGKEDERKNPFAKVHWCRNVATTKKNKPLASRWVYAFCFVGGQKAKLHAEYQLDEKGQAARIVVEDRLTTPPSETDPQSPAAPTIKLSTHVNGEVMSWYFVVAPHRLAPSTLRRYARFRLASAFDLGAHLRDEEEGVTYAAGKMGNKVVCLPVYDLVNTEGLVLKGPRPGVGIPVIDFVTVALTRRAQYIAAANQYMAIIKPTGEVAQAMVSRYLLALFVKKALGHDPTLVDKLENHTCNRVDGVIEIFHSWIDKARLALERAAFRLVTLLKSRYWETVGHAHFDLRDGTRSKALADLQAYLEERLHESEIGRRYLRKPSAVTRALLDACDLPLGKGGEAPSTDVEMFLKSVPWVAAGEPSLGATALLTTHHLPKIFRSFVKAKAPFEHARELEKTVNVINSSYGPGNQIFVVFGKGKNQHILDGGFGGVPDAAELRAQHAPALAKHRQELLEIDEKAVARFAKRAAVAGEVVLTSLKIVADIYNNAGRIVAFLDKDRDKRTWFDTVDAVAGGATLGKNALELMFVTKLLKDPTKTPADEMAMVSRTKLLGSKAALNAIRVIGIYGSIVDVAAAFNDQASAFEDGDFEAGQLSFAAGEMAALNGILALLTGVNPLFLIAALALQSGLQWAAVSSRNSPLQNFLRHYIFGETRNENAKPAWAVGGYQDWTNDAKGLALQLETLYPLLTRFIVSSVGRATIQITFGYYPPGTMLNVIYADELSPGRIWLEIDLDAASFDKLKPKERDGLGEALKVLKVVRRPDTNELSSLQIAFRDRAEVRVTQSVVRVFLSTVLQVVDAPGRELLSPHIPVPLGSAGAAVVGNNAKRLMRSLDGKPDDRGVIHPVIEATGSYKISSPSKPTPSVPA